MNVTFTNEEFEKLEALRKESVTVNWHDFLLLSFGIVKEEELERRK
jgi:hypothetical protein